MCYCCAGWLQGGWLATGLSRRSGSVAAVAAAAALVAAVVAAAEAVAVTAAAAAAEAVAVAAEAVAVEAAAELAGSKRLQWGRGQAGLVQGPHCRRRRAFSPPLATHPVPASDECRLSDAKALMPTAKG